MNSELENNPEFRSRWAAVEVPGNDVNQEVFHEFYTLGGNRKKVLNCALTPERAKELVQFSMPNGWDWNKSLRGSAGIIDPGLEDWAYQPMIRPQQQLPYFKKLPAHLANLVKSPWTHYPSRGGHAAVNARLLRYHSQLWNELRPKTLRGVFTTLVYVTPQIGFSLMPHIQLDPVFLYFAALSRAAGPCQMMPAAYLYPDARINGLEDMPATMFADILPHVGGDAFPLMECTPNPWNQLARYHIRNYYYGYPFGAISNSAEDITLSNYIKGGMVLPEGQTVAATNSQSYVYATLNDELRQDLLLDRKAFMLKHGLARGTITFDGLPFQIPPEMQACIFAITITGWELEMHNPGDLSKYTLRTQHAAIRSYHYYQQVERYYSNFMRLLHELAKDSNFSTYLLSNHLSNSWLGGNLLIPNQHTWAEQKYGATFVRNFYHQQLDWLMGITNLWNQVEFRKDTRLEERLPQDGVIFHQMRNLLACNSHLFYRPIKKTTYWYPMHPMWMLYDQDFKARRLPSPPAEN